MDIGDVIFTVESRARGREGCALAEERAVSRERKGRLATERLSGGEREGVEERETAL